MATLGYGLTVHSLGTTLNVSLPDQDFYGEFHAVLPAHWKTVEASDASLCLQIVECKSDSATPTYELRIDGVTVMPDLSRAAANNLLHEKLDYYLGEFSDRFAFIHAGVVRWQDEVILLPGRSHAGKTTLTAALVQAGADYVSDDLAVIGPGATVQLLSQPIRLRADVAGGFDLSAACRQPDLLATDHAPIAGIVFLQYCAGQNLHLQALSKGEATQRLMANSMNARHQPQLVMQYCAAAAQRAWCLQGVRGDAAQAADYILNHVVTP